MYIREVQYPICRGCRLQEKNERFTDDKQCLFGKHIHCTTSTISARLAFVSIIDASLISANY